MRNNIFLASSIIFGILAVAGAGCPKSQQQPAAQQPYVAAYKAPLSIAGQTYLVEVVDTEESRAKGLGGRQPLQENEGMLFLFPNSEMRTFWMKDVSFPIDIVWIQDNVVVGVEENVPPASGNVSDTLLPRYSSVGPANAVLELTAGQAKKHRIGMGTQIQRPGEEN